MLTAVWLVGMLTLDWLIGMLTAVWLVDLLGADWGIVIQMITPIRLAAVRLGRNANFTPTHIHTCTPKYTCACIHTYTHLFTFMRTHTHTHFLAERIIICPLLHVFDLKLGKKRPTTSQND